MDDLIALARAPLARPPKVPPRAWPGVLTGKTDLTGIPIPEDDLDVPDIWRPVIAHLGAPRAQMAAEEMLNWLVVQGRSGEMGALRPADPEATEALLQTHASLGAVFGAKGEWIDFEDHVREADRQALRAHVARIYRPLIRR